MDKTYSDVIDPKEYTSWLMKHLWIPQIDSLTLQKIVETTQKLLTNSLENVTIIELGCGPGRLTNRIAQLFSDTLNVKIIWVDSDQSFIDQAIQWITTTNIEYIHSKLPKNCPKWDIFLAYGVWHHLDNKGERIAWKEMIKEKMSDNWSLFIWDEFIADYDNEQKRIYNAALLYLNVIWDWYNIANEIDELVKIEIMNLVEDLFGSGYGKGVIREDDFEQIAILCSETKHKLESEWYNNYDISPFIKKIVSLTERAHQSGLICESRGDYKISVSKQVTELDGFALRSVHFSGNSKLYGGMWLLEFAKRQS